MTCLMTFRSCRYLSALTTVSIDGNTTLSVHVNFNQGAALRAARGSTDHLFFPLAITFNTPKTEFNNLWTNEGHLTLRYLNEVCKFNTILHKATVKNR